MIVVKVELWSAATHRKTEIARMQIDNIGGTQSLGDYHVMTCRGRSEKALSQFKRQREGHVLAHPRLSQHVWNLVAKALRVLDYQHE